MRSRLLVLVVLPALALCFSLTGLSPAHAEVWYQQAQFLGDSSGDGFGLSVAIDGDTAIVSAPYDDDGGSNAGAAHIYQQQAGGSWAQVAKVTASNAAANDRSGQMVAIDGDVAILSSFEKNSRHGWAWIYERNEGGPNNWGEVAALHVDKTGYGFDVSVDGDTAVVGAYSTGTSGRAYIYQRDNAGNWNAVTSVGEPKNYYATELSLSGDTLMVGAFGDYTQTTNAGAVFVYERDQGGADNWGKTATLYADVPGTGDYFGRDVWLHGNTAIIGAYTEDGKGAAYLFRNDGNAWDQLARLSETDLGSGDNYGFRCSIAGPYAAVAASKHDDPTDGGAVYLYKETSLGVWELLQKTRPDGLAASDYFGSGVDIYGSTMIIGANGFGAAGAAYIYHMPEPTSLSLLALGALALARRRRRK